MGRTARSRDRKSKASARTGPDVRDADALFDAYRKTRTVDLAARVYESAAPRLRIFAATLLNDSNDVDDAVQETFVAAFTRPESWDADRPFLPWLAGILRNRVLNRKRAEGRRKRREAATVAPGDAGSAADPLAEMSAAEVLRAVESGIESLPSTYRPVVANRLLDGATSAEIARQLGRAENTIRVQLRRGLRMLRDALPVGIGAALAIALVPTRATAAASTAVLDDALAGAVRRGARLRLFRNGVLVLGAAAIPLAAWIALSGRDDAPLTPESTTEVVTLPVDATDPTARGFVVDAAHTGRVTVAVPSQAGLAVELLMNGRPAVGAPVSIERVEDLDLLVSVVTDAYGSRRDFEVPGAARAPTRQLRTDGSGAARFAPTAGRYLIRVPGNGTVAELRGGIERRIRFDLTGLATPVTCRVVDASGAACAAEIWASRGPADVPLTRLGRTDADGRFTSALPPGAIVQARVDDRASAAVRVATSKTELLLPLAAVGHLHGILRGPDRRPVADAVVEVADAENPSRTTTDADGRFDIPGVREGAWLLTGRSTHAPFAFARSEVRVQRGSTADVVLELAPTATVRGRVTDPAGSPVFRTQVRVGWAMNRLDAVSATTDRGGRYELLGVPPLRTKIAAGLGDDGYVQETIEPRAGQDLIWNAALSPDDLRIAGRVETPATTLELVIAFDTVSHFQPTVAAIADGRFAVTLPPEAAGRTLAARIYAADVLAAQGIRRSFPLAVRQGVDPGDLEFAWSIPAIPEPNGDVRARVVFPVAGYGGRVRLTQQDTGHWIELGQPTGTERHLDVHAERLPAGRYALQFDASLPEVPFELADGQHLDLGDLALPQPGGTSAVNVSFVFRHPGDATPMDRLEVDVSTPDGRRLAHAGVPGRRGEWRIELPVAPGPARLVARTTSGLVAETEILVSGAEGQTIEVPLRRAQSRD